MAGGTELGKGFSELNDPLDQRERFEEQEKLGQGTISAFDIDDVKKWAGELGLNAPNFNQCLDSGKYAAEVKKDFDDGSKAGVSGTPTFFVNGEVLVGAQPIQTFIQAIDSGLKK